MVQYFGDFAEDDTVLIPFNTFDSNDPSASVTITNLADADIMVHKDGSLTQIVTDGATVVINFDGITGNHMVTIDTSVDAAYSTGSEYAVRIEGTTVDGATINAWIGSFSIERAGGTLALIKAGNLSSNVVQWLGTAAAAPTTAGVPSVALTAIGLDAIGQAATGMVEIAKAIWDRVLNGANHNITNSAGKRIRQLVESGNYALGLVWLDTNVANTGSTDFQDGTEVNPTSLIASVNTLLASLPLHGCHVASNSTVTLATAQENQEWTGRNWTLALGGQSIAGSSIINAVISGISTGVPGAVVDCFLNACTFAGGDFIDCALGDTITLSGATGYHFFNCHHGEMGAPSTIDFGAAVGATEVHLHHWHGNLTILNMKAGDILHFSCSDGALTLDATCVAGTVNLSGEFGLTDNSSGMTINDIGRGTLLTIASEARLSELAAGNLPSDIDDILTDTANMQPKLGSPAGTDMSADIADLPTVSEFETRTLTAADIVKLSASVGTIVSAAVETGTLSSTQMTPDLSEATNDHYIGRIILWTSGPLTNQATDITDYVGTNGLLTFTEVTDVPVDGNTFIIV